MRRLFKWLQSFRRRQVVVLDIQSFVAGPDDTVVLRYGEHLTPHQKDVMRESIQALNAPGRARVIVVEGPWDMCIKRGELSDVPAAQDVGLHPSMHEARRAALDWLFRDRGKSSAAGEALPQADRDPRLERGQT